MNDKRMDELLRRKMELDFDEIEGRRSAGFEPEVPATRRWVAAALVLIGLGATVGVAVLANRGDEGGDAFEQPAVLAPAQGKQEKEAPQGKEKRGDTSKESKPRLVDLEKEDAALQRRKNEILEAQVEKLKSALAAREDQLRRMKDAAPEPANPLRDLEEARARAKMKAAFAEAKRAAEVKRKREAELEAARAAELKARAQELQRKVTLIKMRGLPGVEEVAEVSSLRTKELDQVLRKFEATKRALDAESDVDRALKLVDAMTRQLGDVRRVLWESKKKAAAERR